MTQLILFYSNHLPEDTMLSEATGPMWIRNMWSRAWSGTQPRSAKSQWISRTMVIRINVFNVRLTF